MNKDQIKQLEADLWRVADNLRANSDLKSSEYSIPVLGIIFLKFVDNKYKQHEEAIQADFSKLKTTRRQKALEDIAVERCGFYLPDHARYDYLLNLPEKEDFAKAIKQAMSAIEQHKPELQGVLPQDEYYRLTRSEQNRTICKQLLKNFADIPADASGDLFGQIYEYFLGKFALSEGQGGGEFFTPRSVVRLMVEIIEPHRGTVFDPACGSGGMFVQSAKFIEQHHTDTKSADENDIYVYGQEKTLETVKLAKMNLAVNGLRGEIRQANTYYEDPYQSFGKFDYVMANPPFNVDDVSINSIEKDQRFNSYGIPRNKTKGAKAEKGKETVPNANYLWISLFATSLKAEGRAALVMANSASDARHSEADIRKKLIDENLIYGILSLPSNMFYTVTLPATLWFFDKAKQDGRILFINARHVFTQIDRAHREFSDEQVQNLGIISQLHRGHRDNFVSLINHYFAQGMEKLIEGQEHIKPLSAQLMEVLETEEGRDAVSDLLGQWNIIKTLKTQYTRYVDDHSRPTKIEPKNDAQHRLRESFDPFFIALHNALKRLDKIVRQHEKQLADTAKADGKRNSTDRKTKALKIALEALHTEVKSAEGFYKHILWLQERFPKAQYEDVLGLCKLATIEEIKDQDFSLNPGRYVGVVIEEDGKSEEEFIDEILVLHDEWETLNRSARLLENTITSNLRQLVGD